MPPLKPRDFQLVLARLARAVGPSKGRRALRSASADVRHIRESRFAVRHADKNHAAMQQRRVKARNGCFLAAVLRGRRRKNAPNFSNQRTFGLKRASLIQKISHLGRHIAKSSRRAKNDRLRLRQRIHRGHRDLRKRRARRFRPGLLEHRIRRELRDLKSSASTPETSFTPASPASAMR